jgi:hypothetical protein
VQSSVIGGAMLPHAPQFFTMPETEDRATVERVKAVAKEIGGRLKALEPALWLIFANDHAEQFFHNVAPPFTVHVGASASGHFAGRDFHWKVPGEIGFEIVKGLYRQGFDPAFTSTAKIDYAMGIPLTHLGVEDPVLPISINAYLPMPARAHRHDVRLALAEHARGRRPAAQFYIASAVQLLFAIADQRLEVAGCKPRQRRLVPGEVGLAIALGAGIMRHAAARDHRGPQTERRHHPPHRLAERIAAFDRRLRVARMRPKKNA